MASALLILLACAPASEGWWVELQGGVVDTDGAAVPDATVQVLDQAHGALLGETQTDDQGRYSVVVAVQSTDDVPLAVHADAGDADGWSYPTLEPRGMGDPEPLRIGGLEHADAAPLPLPSTWIGEGQGSFALTLLDLDTGGPPTHQAVDLVWGLGAPDDWAASSEVTTDGDGVAQLNLACGGWTARVGGASWPLIACAGDQVLAVSSQPESGLIAAATGAELVVTGPRAGDPNARFVVSASNPQHPEGGGDRVAEHTVVGAVERVQVFGDAGGEHRIAGVPASGVLQVWWAGGQGWAVADPSGQDAVWVGLQLDPATGTLLHPEEYSDLADPDDPTSF